VHSLIERLKRRKLVQWTMTYLAVAWGAAEVVDVFADPWGVSDGLIRTVQAVLALGVPIAVVLAWYHGERGHQRVTRPEALIVSSLVLLSVTVLFVYNPLAERIDPDSIVEIDPNSILVLPFLDQSPGQDQEYMAHGVASQVLSLLAQIPEMRVTPQTTAFSFADRSLGLPEIAAQARVAHVLEGSVRTAGDAIRITAHLVDPRTGDQLFSRQYDGVMGDIFALQDSIAVEVVTTLRVAMLGQMPTLQVTDPEGYRLFLQAKHLADQLSQDAYQEVRTVFAQVLAIDPNYAPAHLELAAIYHDESQMGDRDPVEGMRRVDAAITRALESDPNNGYAFAMRGGQIMNTGDLADAAELYARALALAPSDPDVLMMSGNYLQLLGRFDESTAVHEFVAELDPLNAVNQYNLAFGHLVARRYEEALEAFDRVVALSPGYVGITTTRAVTMMLLGNLDAALAEAEMEVSPVYRLAGLASIRDAREEFPERDSLRVELEREWAEAAPVLVAILYAWSGDADSAFAWLGGLSPFTARAPSNLAFFPLLEPIHDDPRWQGFLDQIGQSSEYLSAIDFEVSLPGG
jgi:adenylate cyclase